MRRIRVLRLSGLLPLALLALAALVGARCGLADHDVNADGRTDAADLAALDLCLGEQPQSGGTCFRADVDRDGYVDDRDRSRVYAHVQAVPCNGWAALCDRAFDEVVYLSTHNAYNNAPDGFGGVNQHVSLSDQLDLGVRSLSLDVHFDPLLGGPPVILCHGLACNLIPTFGSRPFSDALDDVRGFLLANPGEVVVIVLEVGVPEPDLSAAFLASGILHHAHVQQPGTPWPTLRELVASGRRLVIFSGPAPPVGYLHSSEFFWPAPFSARTPDEFRCGPDATPLYGDLWAVNHYVITPVLGVGSPSQAPRVNQTLFALHRALECGDVVGQPVNFVHTDFVSNGGVPETVDILNGVAPMPAIEGSVFRIQREDETIGPENAELFPFGVAWKNLIGYSAAVDLVGGIPALLPTTTGLPVEPATAGWFTDGGHVFRVQPEDGRSPAYVYEFASLGGVIANRSILRHTTSLAAASDVGWFTFGGQLHRVTAPTAGPSMLTSYADLAAVVSDSPTASQPMADPATADSGWFTDAGRIFRVTAGRLVEYASLQDAVSDSRWGDSPLAFDPSADTGYFGRPL